VKAEEEGEEEEKGKINQLSGKREFGARAPATAAAQRKGENHKGKQVLISIEASSNSSSLLCLCD
jgi:hypothetical protein